MIGRNGICYVFHQNRLTGLGLCDNQCALSFSNGREQVDDTCREVCRTWIAAEGELFFRKQRRKMLERNAVAYL